MTFLKTSGQTPRRRYPKVYPLGQAQGNADQETGFKADAVYLNQARSRQKNF